MRLHRFFIDSDLASHKAGGTFLIEDPAINHQLSKVLRASSGDPIQLFDRHGNEITGTVRGMKKNETEVLIDQAQTHADSGKKTTLYLAMLKRENFELAVQKATEVGITDIVPLLTERTVKTGFNRVRLEKIITEAAEQSGRTSLPSLTEPVKFAEAIQASHEIKLFLDLGGSTFATYKGKSDTALFVGPEGGWSEAERATAKNARCAIATISPNVLRAETAAIIGSYLIIGN